MQNRYTFGLIEDNVIVNTSVFAGLDTAKNMKGDWRLIGPESELKKDDKVTKDEFKFVESKGIYVTKEMVLDELAERLYLKLTDTPKVVEGEFIAKDVNRVFDNYIFSFGANIIIDFGVYRDEECTDLAKDIKSQAVFCHTKNGANILGVLEDGHLIIEHDFDDYNDFFFNEFTLADTKNKTVVLERPTNFKGIKSGASNLSKVTAMKKASVEVLEQPKK